jgi:hypothetical protein
MHSYLLWKHRSIIFFNFAKPFFDMSLFTCWNCMLDLFSRIVSLTHHIFEKKSLTFFRWPFSKKCMICHCFLSCSCQCFNLFFFHIKGFFVLFQHINLFKKKKSLKNLVLFMKIETSNMRIKNSYKQFLLGICQFFITLFVF